MLSALTRAMNNLKFFCRETWKDEDSDYLNVDRSTKKEDNFCICNERNKAFEEFKPETNPFYFMYL